MLSLVKIYQGGLKNHISDTFCFKIGSKQKVKGVLCQDNIFVNMLIDNGRKIILNNVFFAKNIDSSPNKRIIDFATPINTAVISGTIYKPLNDINQNTTVSLYIIIEE